MLDLNKASFEDIIGRLKAYKERIADEEEEQEEQNKFMYVNSDAQRHQNWNNDYRNKGREGRFFGNRSQGRGRFGGNKDLPRIESYWDKTGHYASNCPDRLLKLQEAQDNEPNETEDADQLMLHEVVYLNEEKIVPSKYESSTGEDDFWYVDNGASNHMSGDRRYFVNIDESANGKVRFGDDSIIDIKGKGSIEFVDRNGKARTMSEVNFIFELKSNIISLGQATESGCDVRMREDFLTLHDREGRLLVKAI
ncbi:hypothetical protein SOVF_057540, partial [Spinacia oleracea]